MTLGVPAAIVPDDFKSAVTKSSKYEPTVNETFLDFSDHYGTAILPARAYNTQKSQVKLREQRSYIDTSM